MCKNATKPVLQLLKAFYLAHIVKFWRGCFSTQSNPHTKFAPAKCALAGFIINICGKMKVLGSRVGASILCVVLVV